MQKFDEIRDAARARELLKIAQELAEKAEKEEDEVYKKRLEADARKYLDEARQLREHSFNKSAKR
jgi:hypothetical protein